MDSDNRKYLLNKAWEFQHSKGYLSDEDVWNLSKDLGISPSAIESVISFYHFYRRKPAGKFTIYLNTSILSVFNGYEEVKAAFERETNANFGQEEYPGDFGLYETSCIGLSDQEPAALINFYPFTKLTPDKVKEIVGALKAGKTPAALADTITEEIRFTPPDDSAILLRKFEAGKSLKQLYNYSPTEVIDCIKRSGLTGRGGAFFPTGMKWELCSKAAGSPKYIVCNADEGEPGSFKDRGLMNLIPELMIEGMIIAGYAVGATQGIIYLRAEYFWLLPKIEKTLDNYRNMGMLGESIPLFSRQPFDIRVQMGAGAYICGEETALLESLEGKRGEPRLKTFFPTDKGFLGKPTVINNVETFSTVARILEVGVEKFVSLGNSKSIGTKLLCVSGDCKYPGLYEIEWGMTVSELLEKCGAEDPWLIQMSGPSGELISILEKERRISCDDIRCEGSVMIFNSKRDLFTILLNFSEFFTHESCGLCTPCRAGNPKLLELIRKLKNGDAQPKDVEAMLQWSDIIKYSSRCGLGNTAPNSLIYALKKFPDLIQSRLKEASSVYPEFNLSKATNDYNQLTSYDSK